MPTPMGGKLSAEPSGVDTHERGGMLLLVAGAAPSRAEGTAGVKPAGGAEKAAAARPEALGLGGIWQGKFEVARACSVGR